MKTFLMSYRYKGSEWSFDIPAESFADAEARLNALKHNGSVDGQLYLRVSNSWWGAGLLIKGLTAIFQAFTRDRRRAVR